MADANPEPLQSRRKTTTIAKLVEVDMNPMVDLAFLLLTFFMLTTTFNQPQAMELVMPAKPKPNETVAEQAIKESKVLNIVLGEGKTLYHYPGISAQTASPLKGTAELKALLIRSKRQIPKLVVLVKAHPKSHFSSLVDVLDELNVENIERYALTPFDETDILRLENAAP